MSSSFSVAELLFDAAALSNCPPFGLNTRVTASQATYWVASACRSLSALLRQHHETDREYVQTALISTVPGLRFTSLPVDCGEVHSVVWHRGDKDYVLLDSANQQHLADAPLDIGKGWNEDESDARWRIEGQTIALYPASGIPEQIEVYYTTHIGPTTGTFQARLDFDQWVTLDVCIHVAIAKNQDASRFEQKKALLENDLLNRARKRDPLERHTIRDVRSESRIRNMRQWSR